MPEIRREKSGSDGSTRKPDKHRLALQPDFDYHSLIILKRLLTNWFGLSIREATAAAFLLATLVLYVAAKWAVQHTQQVSAVNLPHSYTPEIWIHEVTPPAWLLELEK